jgi:hypothetical protein
VAFKSAKRQFLVRIDGVDGYWASRTGGRKDVATTKVFDGGSRIADILTANPLVDDLTLTRPFDRDRDGPLVHRLLPLAGVWDTMIYETPTDENLVPSGDPLVYNVRLVGVHPPEPDAGGGATAAEFVLLFAARDVA